jgi:hypothetical protein
MKNDTSGFFDKLSISSGIELELGPSRIKGFFYCVFFFWLSHRHFSTEFNIKTHFGLVVTSTLAPHLARKKIIQNGVNIQDGDFTFST